MSFFKLYTLTATLIFSTFKAAGLLLLATLALALPIVSVMATPKGQYHTDALEMIQDPDTLNKIYVVNDRANGPKRSLKAGTSVQAEEHPRCVLVAPGAHTVGTQLKTAEEAYRGQLLVNSSFSPQRSGYDGIFTIEGIEYYPNNELTVFDKNGMQRFHQKGYRNNWDGTVGNKILTDGTYYYVLKDGVGGIYSGYIQVHL